MIRSPFLEFSENEHEIGVNEALRILELRLSSLPVTAWFECSERFAQGGEHVRAAVILEAAIPHFPANSDLVIRCAQALMTASDDARAESLLRKSRADHPHNQAVIERLAEVIRKQGRYSEAVALMRAFWDRNRGETRIAVACSDFIMGSQRESEAAAICEYEIAHGSVSPDIFAIAGSAALLLGQFELAQQRLISALDRGVNLNERFVAQPLSMTQQLKSRSHPMFSRIEKILTRAALTPRARAATLFSQAKLYDDLKEYSLASAALRQANRLMDSAGTWNRDHWGKFVEEQLLSQPKALPVARPLRWTPVFIVGLPRSGTSLIAERLAGLRDVQNRGELGLIPFLASRLSAKDNPPSGLFQSAAQLFAAHARQDDAPAKWYIDKNPVNFRFVGLIARLFPNARIVWCRRNLRDTALSSWSHYFHNPENGFSRSFSNIALYASGAHRLMTHWKASVDVPIFECTYEEMISNPERTLNAVKTFLDLPLDTLGAVSQAPRAVATASAWQVRQPIHDQSIKRWQRYAPYLPELVDTFPDADAVA